MSNPRRDIVNFFLSDSEIGAEILKTLSVFRTTMSCNSFSFIPFTNTLHSWKYDKAKYYRHVLSGLFSVSPNETAKNARIILQSTIDEYIQQVREDTSLPEWSETHFANLCTEIKQNTRHGGCTGSLSRYELRSARGRGRVNRVVTHLKALFDGLNECEVLNILNVYSVSHPVQYGHAIKLKPPETEDKPPGKRRLTRGADLKLFVLDYHQLKVMKASDFEHKKAFTELNIGSLKTLNKYLSIIHCMQRKGVTFTQKFGDESMKHVVKNYLEYDKLELLYKDEQNQINSDFTLDMQGLGIELDNCNDVTMNNASNDDFTLDMPGLGSGLDNVINLSNATTAIQSVSGLRLPVINGTNLTQYGHHVDRNAISWNDNVTFRHNPMNTMHMQEPRNAFGSGYYNPYM
eukprot:986714_1